MNARNLLFALLIFALGCKEQGDLISLKEGPWRAILEVQEGQELPFLFEVQKSSDAYRILVSNADEVIEADEIRTYGDSIRIQLPVFEGYITGVYDSIQITGQFVKESLDQRVPFKARFGKAARFEAGKPATVNVSGIWETVFYSDAEKPYVAKGIFTQQGDKLTGTFRTTTGDYRYLEGVVQEDTIRLSTFDGAHAFLFTAKATDSTLQGKFYSGNHSLEYFEARRNERYELPDEDTLTYLKKGYDRFSFAFPDSSRKTISNEDAYYAGKVLIVQIMGTWCPNCLDESRFLVEYLKDNPNPQLEVVALSFEYAKTEELAFKAINRLKDRLGISYPILLAQYGTSNKQKANEKLPMLNNVLSYPTTIFIDKKGNVRKITTGFNGPATGQKYLDYRNEFDDFVNLLLKE